MYTYKLCRRTVGFLLIYSHKLAVNIKAKYQNNFILFFWEIRWFVITPATVIRRTNTVIGNITVYISIKFTYLVTPAKESQVSIA